MKIYFVSHSATIDNEKKIASGWNNPPLSDIGKKQAMEIRSRFVDKEIELVCVSDLERALETCRAAFGNAFPVLIDKRLRETNFGLFNGSSKSIIEERGKMSINVPFPEGESYKESVERTCGFYSELAQFPYQRVIVVGHRSTHWALEILYGNKKIEDCVSEKFVWQPWWEYETRR